MKSKKPQIHIPKMKELIQEQGSVYGNKNAWEFLSQKINELNPSKVFVITDTNTRVHCLPYFQSQTAHSYQLNTLEVLAGEKHKNLHTCLDLWEQLSNLGADRKSLIINIGGGVVTDLGGFVASCFKRGIAFINIPTSLLAMVDASVGGKNGVDLGGLKNQIGIIRQPLMVIVDTGFLKTLPKPHFISGMAEMIKHGLISSSNYLQKIFHLNENDPDQINDLIWDSILIKNKVVTKDPSEKGLRKSLNYGHTLGHAIESYFLETEEKTTLLHGEAIAIGMILATFISSEILNFPKDELNKISGNLIKLFKKVQFSQEDKEAIIKLLIYDKKNENGKIYFVLLEDIGKISFNHEVSNDLIYKAFDFYQNL